jgi:hypothetical protein
MFWSANRPADQIEGRRSPEYVPALSYRKGADRVRTASDF